MKPAYRTAIAVACFVFLLWFWPNFVHEPLHWAALAVQGIDSHITLDLSHIPAHPYITRIGQVHSTTGALFYVLAPSLFSLVLLWIILKTRRHAGLLTHIVPAIYLSFDLVVNVLKHETPTSDFHFLVALPSAVYLLLVSGAVLFGAYVTLRSMARFKTLGEMTLRGGG